MDSDCNQISKRLSLKSFENLVDVPTRHDVIVEFGEWRSPVAHSLWERRVAGSNPVSPT